jgi:polyhydroxybutyrate depolymerase
VSRAGIVKTMTRWAKTFLVFLSLLGIWGCSENLPGFEALQPGTYEHILDIRVAGFRRSYLLHIPKSYDRTKPLPLVVALHGGFGTAEKMAYETGFSEIADREGFLVLYPNGISLFGWLQHWNARHCCGKAMKDDIDDVGFIALVIQQACRYLKVDRARIYLMGYSNGGMLAHLFAAQNPEILAAVAVIAGSIGSKASPLEPEVRIYSVRAPVPIVVFHGRKDDIIPYDGGNGTGWGHVYVSVKESMDFWVKANRCGSTSRKESLLQDRVLKETWAENDREEKTVLYSLEGWKHTLPTRPHTQGLPETDPLKGFHASDVIWNFFKGHRR